MNTSALRKRLPLSVILFLPLFLLQPESSWGTRVDPEAEEALRAMCSMVSQAKTLRSTAETHIHISVGKMENKTITKSLLTIQRPNLLSMEVQGGKLPFSIISDGTHLTTLIPALTAYTVKEAPKKLVGVLEGVEGNLILQQASLQIFLLREDPYGHFVNDSSAVEYIGKEDLEGVSCHRIRIRQKESFLDLYIQANGQPILRRITPDTAQLIHQLESKMPGIEVQMWVDFQGWDFNPELDSETFAFVPPEWASKRDSFLTSRPPNPATDLVGKPAPELEVELLGGGKFNLAADKGKNIVILDFWGTRCPPCVVGLPILAQIAKEYQDKNVRLVAVNVQVNRGDSPEVIEAFRQKYDLSGLNVGLDTDGKAGALYRVTSIPQTVVVGKDGVVQKVYVGIMRDRNAQVEEYRKDLDKLLAGENLF